MPLTHFIRDASAYSRTGSSGVTSAPRRYTLGPFVEVRPWDRLALETGFVYKRFGFDAWSAGGPPTGPFVSVRSVTSGNSLEIPVLAKVRLSLVPGLNAYLGAGPSFRRLFSITERGQRTVRTYFPPPGGTEITAYETDAPEGLNRRTSLGLAVAAGVEMRTGPLRLAPGIRLTRWDTERTSSAPSASRLARTQAEVLLGISYARGPEAKPVRLPGSWEFGLYAALPFLATSQVQDSRVLMPVTVDAPARRFAGGAFIDARFHPRLSLEAGFLTGRFGHTERAVYETATVTESLSGYSWEVPLLLKWRAARLGSTPLWFGAGPSLRRASHIDWTSTSNGSTYHLDGSWFARTALGFTAAGGVEIRKGKIRLRPELRYSRFERPIYDLSLARTRRDSLHLVLGISPAGSL